MVDGKRKEKRGSGKKNEQKIKKNGKWMEDELVGLEHREEAMKSGRRERERKGRELER